MIKTFIDKLSETEGNVIVRLCTEEGYYEIELNDEVDRYEELMRGFIEIGIVSEIEVLIVKTEDDGTKYGCTAGIYPMAQNIALMDKGITEKVLKLVIEQIEESEEDEEYEIDIDYSEIIPDDFENMFGEFKNNEYIIKFDSDEGCDAAKVVIDKLSETDKTVIITEIGGVGYTLFSDANKEERLDALYDLFFTDGMLTDGADMYIEIEDNGKKRVCTITVTRDELTIHGSSIAKKLIYGEDVSEEDIDKDVSVEDFESIFGKITEKFVTRIHDISFDFTNK